MNPTSKSAVLELKGVNKFFGGVQAVSDMSFVIRRGELAGLIGPNGAGKTTIFNLVTGVYDTTAATSSSWAKTSTPCGPIRSSAWG